MQGMLEMAKLQMEERLRAPPPTIHVDVNVGGAPPPAPMGFMPHEFMPPLEMNMQTMSAVVPDGLGPGMEMDTLTPAGLMRVVIPEGVHAGQPFSFTARRRRRRPTERRRGRWARRQGRRRACS